MSKISSMLRATRLNEYAASPLGTIRIATEVQKTMSSISYERLQRVQVVAELGCKAWATEGEDLAPLVERVRRALIHELFGEFLAPLMEIDVALYERDVNKAQMLVEKLRTQMLD